MPRDYELDSLRTELNRAYENKQSAYSKMRTASQARSEAKAALDSSWEKLQNAREEYSDAREDSQREWDYYKSEKARLSDMIDEVANEADHYHERACQYRDDAKYAYDSGDKVSAASYAESKREYLDLRDAANERKAELIRETKSISKPNNNRVERAKEAKEQAEREHRYYSDRYASIRETHEHAKNEFESAKQEYDEIHARYIERKNALQSERSGNWSPVYSGNIGDKPVLVRFGEGSKSGQTLISDFKGQSNRAFNKKGVGHNHYGPGFAVDRGKYTGPGH